MRLETSAEMSCSVGEMRCSGLYGSPEEVKAGEKPQRSPLSLDLEASGFCGHDGITHFKWRKGEEDVEV